MIDEISVVIPAYNEAENIEGVVRRIFDVLNRLFHRYELIVVNDGSSDGTGQILQRLVQDYHNLRIINFEENRGYGAALREGFKKAELKYIFYTDADGQFEVDEIAKILPLMERCEVVAGYRLKRADTLMRRITSMIYNRFVSLFLRIKFRDINCSFKLFQREIIDNIDLGSKGFSIDAELLWKASLAGYKICECGVSHYKRGKGRSKVRLKDSMLTFKELLDIKGTHLKREQ